MCSQTLGLNVGCSTVEPGVGLGDTYGSLPTLAVPWFCDYKGPLCCGHSPVWCYSQHWVVLHCSASPLKAAHSPQVVTVCCCNSSKAGVPPCESKGGGSRTLFGTISSHKELCHCTPGLGNAPNNQLFPSREGSNWIQSCLSLLQERAGKNYSLPPGKVWLYIPKHQKLKSKRNIIADINVTGSLLLRVLIGFCNYIPSSLCHK